MKDINKNNEFDIIVKMNYCIHKIGHIKKY